MKKKIVLPLPPLLSALEPQDFYLEEELLFEGAFFEGGDYSYDACKNLILKQCHF